MNQRYLWTIVALFLTAVGMPSVGHTQTTTTKETTPVSQKSSVSDAVKVGEFKTSAGKSTSDAVMITNIHSHNIGDRKAATLFIKNIPVLTFLSSQPVASVDTKVGVIGDNEGQQSYALIAGNSAKLTNIGSFTNARNQKKSLHDDPVHRAGLIAASINQIVRNSEDAEKITVSWKGEGESTANQAQNKSASVQQQPKERYTIKINNQELVEINAKTILAGTTDNLAQDALQATNRLRRLIGDASPITEIAGLPEPARISISQQGQQIANNIRLSFRGLASFYGRGFAGRPTATGERFNPEAMTAAHRSLPFGTRVRVTNTRNGRSVVVRINDRGPFIRGRVIDVSTGAARAIGMINSGVAPVKIEVLGR